MSDYVGKLRSDDFRSLLQDDHSKRMLPVLPDEWHFNKLQQLLDFYVQTDIADEDIKNQLFDQGFKMKHIEYLLSQMRNNSEQMKDQNLSEEKLYELRKWQKEAWIEIDKFFLNKIKSGLIVAPTGSGKSDLIIYVTLMYIELFNTDVIIMTKRKEIFDIRFRNTIRKRIKLFKEREWIDADLNIRIVNCIDKNLNHTCFNNKSNNHNIYIINSDKFTSSKKFEDYKNYSFGKIKLFIHDESHWAGGKKIYNFLRYIKKTVCHLIGFSATPFRVNRINQQPTFKIYGDGLN